MEEPEFPGKSIGEALRRIKRKLRSIGEDLARIWKDVGTPGKTWQNIGIPQREEEESEREE